MKTIRNLGRVATILARAEALEIDLHADVQAWNAPPECHIDVARGEWKRQRLARRHAEATAQRPFRVIKHQLSVRGCPIGSKYWEALVWRLCRHPCLKRPK